MIDLWLTKFLRKLFGERKDIPISHVVVHEPFNWALAGVSSFIGFLTGIIVPGVILFFVYVLYLPELPNPESLEEFQPTIVSKMFSADGELLAEFASERRIWVSIDDVSQWFIKALLVTEDRRFFKHWGIDPLRIAGAMVANIRSGRIAQGGSTITQQLARTLYLSQQKVLARKIKEALTSIRLEAKYSKSEILELYMNQVFMGRGAYGVQSAANINFDKEADKLGPTEAATIVAMLPAPSYYSRNLDKTILRRNMILKLMAQSNFMPHLDAVNEQTIDSLCKIDFAFRDRERGQGWKAPYFVDFVRQKLAEKYGEDWLYTQGVSVYTTLDYDLNKAVEETLYIRLRQIQRSMEVTHYKDDPQYTELVTDTATGETTRVWKQVQGGVMALENETGRIIVMVGGKNFQNNQFNRVTQAIRQPGSAFKPFVYTAAIDNGWQPTDKIDDSPGVWPIAGGKLWRPKNYDDTYMGKITLRESLQRSRNLSTIRLTEMVGPANVIKYAQSLGITASLDPVLSVSMGSSGVRIWDMVIAYSVFPNQGVKVKPVFIDKIIDRNGTILDEWKTEKSEVLSKGTAYIMTSMMQSVVDHGTGYGARLYGFLHPAAGKTGTTNDYVDASFYGFTRKLTAGVSIGYNDMTSLGDGMTGSRAALPIWTKLMLHYYPKGPTAADSFEVPYSEVVLLDVCFDSGKLATGRCPRVVHDVFLRKNMVPEEHCPLSHSGYSPSYYGDQPVDGSSPTSEPVPPANIDQIDEATPKGGL